MARSILITGSSHGIGAGCAIAFARAYVAYSTNDSVVPQEYNGKAMCTALKQAGVEYCAKEYAEGGHSINWSDFPSCLHDWLKTF